MTPETVFTLANLVALVGWAALLVSPFAEPRAPGWSDRVAALVVPGLLAAGYVATIALFWGRSEPVGEPGFTTLQGVRALLGTPEALVAGWIHYLAFDLFVGAWEARDARRRAIPFGLVVPCLLFTFVSGPFGFALYLALRAAMGRRGQ